MLRNSFVHIPGIGKNTEEQIWKNDVYSWEEFLENKNKVRLSKGKKEMIAYNVQKSMEAYEKKDHRFFHNNFPNNLHWRAYKDFKDKCCFLDIETTGLDKHNDEVTVIGIYDGKESKIFIQGKNMDEFEEEMQKYSLIVSFNGRCFDIPFLKNKFPNVDFDKLHIDLRFAMRELGFAGGLKRIEQEIGIVRDDDLQEVDGFEAVRLWYKYKRGDEEALDLLVKYNKADIENLKVMMEFAFEKLKQKDFHEVIT